MGRHPCDECFVDTYYGESGFCEKCGFCYGDGNTLCHDCFGDNIDCDLCKVSGCTQCLKTAACCGATICKDPKMCNADAVKGHAPCTLPCGHPGCSQFDGCRSCKRESDKKAEEAAIEKDKAAIKAMLDAPDEVQSKALRSTLERWLEDPTGLRLKREREEHASEIKEMRENNFLRSR
eukprot:m.464078 g.464078  ORF g.464078 m.464078 type:complete len:178 (+) comp23311_c0_seq1:230-763(+)